MPVYKVYRTLIQLKSEKGKLHRPNPVTPLHLLIKLGKDVDNLRDMV